MNDNYAQNIVKNLSADEISQRLDELHAEEAALRTLLRASRARDRRLPRKSAPRPCALAGTSAG